ncbi:hypothetical protein V8E54_014364 [Elaphomyces granulatus]
MYEYGNAKKRMDSAQKAVWLYYPRSGLGYISRGKNTLKLDDRRLLEHGDLFTELLLNAVANGRYAEDLQNYHDGNHKREIVKVIENGISTPYLKSSSIESGFGNFAVIACGWLDYSTRKKRSGAEILADNLGWITKAVAILERETIGLLWKDWARGSLIQSIKYMRNEVRNVSRQFSLGRLQLTSASKYPTNISYRETYAGPRSRPSTANGPVDPHQLNKTPGTVAEVQAVMQRVKNKELNDIDTLLAIEKLGKAAANAIAESKVTRSVNQDLVDATKKMFMITKMVHWNINKTQVQISAGDSFDSMNRRGD